MSNLSFPACRGTNLSLSSGTQEVATGPVLVFGVYCNVVIAAGAVVLKNKANPSGPNITLPAAMAAGTRVDFPGVQFSDGLDVQSAAASGEILVEWRYAAGRPVPAHGDKDWS